MSSVQPLIDAAGRRRSPATMPGFRAGKAPRNKGQRYPADPPTVEEIVALMRQAHHARYGHRLNGLIAIPGTSAWQPVWAQLLPDKHVTLVMDCDPPGRAAAAKIAASLSAAGIRVDVVDLAPGRSDGYDLTDRILERHRQRTGPLNARAVAALLRPVPTVNHTRTRAHARNTQEVAR